MKNTYAHVGYPKCASSALQGGFFARHPDLYHLGVSGGGTIGPYISEEIKLAIEVDFRLLQDFMFDLTKLQELFARHYADFEGSGRRLMGISSESFTMKMHNELDVTQKAERLQKVLGSNTKIIMILRNQPDLMRSIYREWIRSGIFFNYNEFWRTLIENPFRSLVADLHFGKMYKLYTDLFGQDNVLVLPFEQLKTDQEGFFGAITDHLGIRNVISEIGKDNVSPPDEILEAIRKLNLVNRNNLGKTVLEPVIAYKHYEFYTSRLGIPIPSSLINDENIVNYNYQLAFAQQRIRPNDPKLDWSMEPWVKKYLSDYYMQANQELQNQLGSRLNLETYGYLGLAPNVTL